MGFGVWDLGFRIWGGKPWVLGGLFQDFEGSIRPILNYQDKIQGNLLLYNSRGTSSNPLRLDQATSL